MHYSMVISLSTAFLLSTSLFASPLTSTTGSASSTSSTDTTPFSPTRATTRMSSTTGRSRQERPSEVDVAIVGGGIGGLATALAFKRLTNITARVYERSPTLRGGEGTALTMWPNGLSAIGAIDPQLLQKVKAAGSVIKKQTFTTTGASNTENTGVLESQYGEPLLSVFWKRLHTQLAEAVGTDMIELGMNCEDVEELPDGVILKFEGGTTVKAKCVLAADGIHSWMRRRFVNDGKPREHGRWIYRSVIRHEDCPAAERDQMLGKINDNPTKLIHWQPCGDDYTYWAVIKRDTEKEPHVRRGKDPEAMKSWLLQEYSDFPEVLGMIGATKAQDILERPVIDRPPIYKWAFGRVLLVGDAAHAMILSVGQGANTALEDAVCIAHYLRDARAMFPGDDKRAISEAFRCFEEVRIPHCTEIQRESEGYAKNAYGSQRKLGGYRLMGFQVTPFAEVQKRPPTAQPAAAAVKGPVAAAGSTTS